MAWIWSFRSRAWLRAARASSPEGGGNGMNTFRTLPWIIVVTGRTIRW